jgi:hypothetical protein
LRWLLLLPLPLLLPLLLLDNSNSRLPALPLPQAPSAAFPKPNCRPLLMPLLASVPALALPLLHRRPVEEGRDASPSSTLGKVQNG